MNVFSRSLVGGMLLASSACRATWDLVCGDTGCLMNPATTYNPCEDGLLGLYPLLVQDNLEDPLELVIHFQNEPRDRFCGGAVVENGGSDDWVVGVISSQTELRLSVPGTPPDQFRVVAWSTHDVAEDPNDLADQDGLFWGGTSITADYASLDEDRWLRSDQPDEDGVLTAYLVREDAP